MKRYSSKFVFVVLAIILIPSVTSAASIYLETAKNTLFVGDTAIVSVKINSEGATINTVEGNISIQSPTINVEVDEFSLANSAFGLWPRTPSLSTDAKTISFVGGVPGGFSIEGATIFKIIFEAKKEGSVIITPQDFTVYSNDGKGTKLPVKYANLSIQVVPKTVGAAANNEWQNAILADKTPPEDFIIVLGQDKSIYDGKKFAFFSALDNQTGIDYYEVSENGKPAVRSGSAYVLTDQTGDVKLNVTAHDKAGNKKVAIYPSEQAEKGISWAFIILVVLVVIVLRIIYRKLRRNKNKEPEMV